MPQNFDLRIDGQSVTVKSGRVVYTFDDANDGFTAVITCDRQNNPVLYAAISPYQAPTAQVYLENELTLTGKLTVCAPIKNAAGIEYQLEGWSNTFNFVDSELAPPYALEKFTLFNLTKEVAKQTATTVIYNGSNSEIFETATITPGMTGFQFIAPKSNQLKHCLSSTVEGNLIIQQADLNQKPVGTIREDDPNSILAKEFKAKYDLRRRYRTYKAITKRPECNGEGVFTDVNITEPRLKLIFANDQLAGAMPEVAEYNAKMAVIEAMTQQIPVVGWRAPNNELFKPGTLLPLVSETLFVPDGFTYFIRSVEYVFENNQKTCNLNLIPPQVYTDKPIVEPWFGDRTKQAQLQYQLSRVKGL